MCVVFYGLSVAQKLLSTLLSTEIVWCFSFQRRLKNPKQLTSEEKIVYKELRRQSHISAEQKRRGSIKVGRRTIGKVGMGTSVKVHW